MVEEERQAAAALVAADPAFAALEASGAPIIAVVGEPLRIVYRNEAARAAIDDQAAPAVSWERRREPRDLRPSSNRPGIVRRRAWSERR